MGAGAGNMEAGDLAHDIRPPGRLQVHARARARAHTHTGWLVRQKLPKTLPFSTPAKQSRAVGDRVKGVGGEPGEEPILESGCVSIGALGPKRCRKLGIRGLQTSKKKDFLIHLDWLLITYCPSLAKSNHFEGLWRPYNPNWG